MTEQEQNEATDMQILGAVLKYCFLLTSIPIASFFVVKNFFFDFAFEPTSSNVYSAAVAIVVLHISLGAYIFRAYSVAEKVPKPVKVD